MPGWPQIQQPPGQFRRSRARDASAGDGRPVRGELCAVSGSGEEVQVILVVHGCRVEKVAHASGP